MVPSIFLACALIAGADAPPASDPPPRPARAVLADGQLTLTQLGHAVQKQMTVRHEGETLPEEFAVAITFVSMTETTLPVRFVSAFHVNGKRISGAQLDRLLSKEAPVLITSAKTVHPSHVQLFKEDVIILVLPEGVVSHGYGHGMYPMPAAGPAPAPRPPEKKPEPAPKPT